MGGLPAADGREVGVADGLADVLVGERQPPAAVDKQGFGGEGGPNSKLMLSSTAVAFCIASVALLVLPSAIRSVASSSFSAMSIV